MESHQNELLNDEEKASIASQGDFFLEVLQKRYGITPQEIIDVIRWAQERKAFAEKLKASSTLAFVGIIASAILMALWEGIKQLAVHGVK